MKIKHKKNRILIQGTGTKTPYIALLATYSAIAIFLTLIYPNLFPFSVFGAFLLLLFKEKINLQIDPESIDITERGIELLEANRSKKFIRIENIHTLYIQETNGHMEFYINNKERVEFNVPTIVNAHSFINKMKRLLKLKLTNSKKTRAGKVQKFVSSKIIDKKKNHINEAHISTEHSKMSKSNYYNIETDKNSLTINTLNKIGFLNRDKLIIDKEYNSIKIHLTDNIPDEIFFSQIKSLEVSIKQNVSGEKGDLVEGEIILITDQFEPITIFHCKVKEENQLDFTSDEVERDLIALKAIIEFQIYSIIDQNIETLDLDALKANQEKLKDILPNENNLEL